VEHADDLDSLLGRPIENQVIAKAIDRPCSHADACWVRELAELAHSPVGRQELKRLLGSYEKPLPRVDAVAGNVIGYSD
jgi:hypothetical protein